MLREIEVGGKKLPLKSSAAIPRMYRIKFRRDIFSDLQKLKKDIEKNEKIKEEAKTYCKKKGIPYDEKKVESNLEIKSLEMFENIAYLMSKHADDTQPNNIDDWLEQFEIFDIYQILPVILEMWTLETEQTSISKKKAGI